MWCIVIIISVTFRQHNGRMLFTSSRENMRQLQSYKLVPYLGGTTQEKIKEVWSFNCKRIDFFICFVECFKHQCDTMCSLFCLKNTLMHGISWDTGRFMKKVRILRVYAILLRDHKNYKDSVYAFIAKSCVIKCDLLWRDREQVACDIQLMLVLGTDQQYMV